MAEIIGKYPVTYNGENVGTLEVKRDGIRTIFSCICRRPSSGILRLYCICGEKVIPVGVMAPCGGGISLSKLYSADSLSKAGLLFITSAVISEDPPELIETKPVTGEWAKESSPWRYFSDGEVVSAMKNVNGAYAKKDGEDTFLAIPFSTDAPFAPMPIFCFGRLENINGKNYIVFTVKNGRVK